MSEADASPAHESVESTETTESAPQNPYAGTKHRVKADGEEQEVAYEDLVADWGSKKASQKRFQEAARMKKEADELLGSLKKGDLKRLKELVPYEELIKFSEQELAEYIKDQDLSPEARDLKKERAENQRLKAEREADNKRQEDFVRAQLEKEVTNELDLEIKQAVLDYKKELGYDLPVTPELFAEIARTMIANLEADETLSKVPAKKALADSWKGIEKQVELYLNTVPSDKLLNMLPQKHRDAIRKADVSDATSQIHNRIRAAQETDEKSTSSKKKTLTTSGYFDELDKRFGSR